MSTRRRPVKPVLTNTADTLKRFCSKKCDQCGLKLSGDYVIRELNIKEGDWLEGKDLNACGLREEGVSIIGIYRSNGNYVGVPKGSTKIRQGDILILYGRAEALKKLDQRQSGAKGDKEHDDAVDTQKEHIKNQDIQERKVQ